MNYGQSKLRFKTLLILCFIFMVISTCEKESLASDIDAPTAVVVDAYTGQILYGKNPHLKLPPASTTKLITAMVALDRLSPDRKVTISEFAANTPSVSPKLKKGEVYTVHALIYMALMRSVNSAAVALAEAVSGSETEFVKLMNEKAWRIGAKDTKFANASGLPGKEQYTTVYDLTKIMSHALSYPLIREAINTRVYFVHSEDGTEHFIQNTNQLLWSEDNMIGGKTGYTNRARHCFVSASRIDNRLVYTALLGGHSRDTLWKDTQLLLSRAEAILSGKDEPYVYTTKEKPVFKAVYKKSKSSEKKKSAVRAKGKIQQKKDLKNKMSRERANQKRVRNAKINSESI